MARIGIIIQGEGRGHQTQAISFIKIIKNTHHQVSCCLVSSEDGVTVPALLQSEDLPVFPFRGPYLIYNRRTNDLMVGKTICKGIYNLFGYIRSIRFINAVMERSQVDLIINFYDVLGGFYNISMNSRGVPYVCIAHQYLMLHQDFSFPPGNIVSRWGVNLNSLLTSMGARMRLALSFDQWQDQRLWNLHVLPPLIRYDLLEEDDEMQASNIILCYVNVPGMIRRILDWHQCMEGSTELHVFMSQPMEDRQGVFFHLLDRAAFLSKMKVCKYLICTAGFESVCEAHYLGKKCLLVPLPKHYEQEVNAYDAQRVEVGINASESIASAIEQLEKCQPNVGAYRSWVESAPCSILTIIESALVDPQPLSVVVSILVLWRRLIHTIWWPVGRMISYSRHLYG